MYDFGATPDGHPFYAMKLMTGVPWFHVFAQRSVEENLDILLRVCEAAAYAHSQGVVHRDLKPDNVMLGEFGELYVMDWGLALTTPKFDAPPGLERSTSRGGTPAYMAPEMATGPIERIGPASDVYLLGAILYEIVTGHPPHRGENAMKCVMAAAKNEITPTDRHSELVEIARKAMATRPEDRFASVLDLLHILQAHRRRAEILGGGSLGGAPAL